MRGYHKHDHVIDCLAYPTGLHAVNSSVQCVIAVSFHKIGCTITFVLEVFKDPNYRLEIDMLFVAVYGCFWFLKVVIFFGKPLPASLIHIIHFIFIQICNKLVMYS